MNTGNIVLDKSQQFAIDVIKFCELLDQNRKYVLSKQLLRAGTSVGANIFEAQHAESRADFIHKMKLAAKEGSETMFWLALCEKIDSYPFDADLKFKTEELLKLISRIILTSKTNLKNK